QRLKPVCDWFVVNRERGRWTSTASHKNCQRQHEPTLHECSPLVIQAPVDDFAAGARTQRPKSAALRAVRGNTMDEMHGAVGEEEVDSARMIAGEIVQPSVGVGGNVDPIVMDQDEGLSGTRGIRPDIGLAGPTDG